MRHDQEPRPYSDDGCERETEGPYAPAPSPREALASEPMTTTIPPIVGEDSSLPPTPCLPMVEKMAKAIAAAYGNVDFWWAYDRIAQAALTALEQPTPEMVEAIHKRWRNGPDFTVRDACASAFTAAIKAARGE